MHADCGKTCLVITDGIVQREGASLVVEHLSPLLGAPIAWRRQMRKASLRSTMLRYRRRQQPLLLRALHRQVQAPLILVPSLLGLEAAVALRRSLPVGGPPSLALCSPRPSLDPQSNEPWVSLSGTTPSPLAAEQTAWPHRPSTARAPLQSAASPESTAAAQLVAVLAGQTALPSAV